MHLHAPARTYISAYIIQADLATGLANLVTFYNPSLIALGGGLARTPELYDGLQAPCTPWGLSVPELRGTLDGGRPSHTG